MEASGCCARQRGATGTQDHEREAKPCAVSGAGVDDVRNDEWGGWWRRLTASKKDANDGERVCVCVCQRTWSCGARVGVRRFAVTNLHTLTITITISHTHTGSITDRLSR